MINQDKQQINIKGIRDGLLVTLGSAGFQDMAAALLDELRQKQAFLQGSRVMIEAGQRPLTTTQLAELQALFTRHELELYAVLAEREETRVAARELGLATRLPGSNTDLNGNALPALQPANNAREAVLNSPGGLLLKETLRSGRSVYHEGPVVVIGDVNPGAEVIAGGDVIVWGRLRGLVHAGALGDETAVICALALTPTQLRIADQIAIPPDDNSGKLSPEQAIIRDGQIIAIPWQGK
ncbi:MAG: septum site-determining protein MinC [Ardenticatenaceae bacterium]|nr:septum site-determining protein MinC [Ardenticatenaceae bacterium]